MRIVEVWLYRAKELLDDLVQRIVHTAEPARIVLSIPPRMERWTRTAMSASSSSKLSPA
jgi:hypothetical protein